MSESQAGLLILGGEGEVITADDSHLTATCMEIATPTNSERQTEQDTNMHDQTHGKTDNVFLIYKGIYTSLIENTRTFVILFSFFHSSSIIKSCRVCYDPIQKVDRRGLT